MFTEVTTPSKIRFFKKPIEKNHKEQNQTIFGDVLNSQVIHNSKSWAQITEAFRPGMFEEPKESPIVENVKDIIIPEVTPSCSEGEWKMCPEGN